MRAFLAFTSFKSHAWRGSPCWHHEPSLTTRASQQKTCLFHPAAGESHPSRLRAAISSQVTASASRPPNFTFPSLPVRQWVLISHRTPARASRPDNLTFSTPRPARLTHPDREYFPPDGCRREPPGNTAFIVMSLPVQRSESWSPVGRRRGAPGQTILLLCLYLSNAASLNLRLDAGEVLPARQSYFLLSLPVQRSESWSPVGRRRGAPGQTILLSLSLPVQHSKSWYLVGRRRGAPGQTTLLFLSLPVQQSKSWYLVGRRRGAPGQTNLTFPVFTCPTQQVLISCWTPARCSRPDKRSSVCSHQKYRTPSNATYPAVLASLAFSPSPARLHHPAHKYQSHLRCRKSLPAGQPHLFLLRQRS